MSMGLRLPNMRGIARRASAKAVFLLGFALLSCVAQSTSRGHLYRAGARRSVLDATNRKVFDVTAFGAKTEDQMKGGGNKANVVGKLSVQELPGGGIPGLPGGSAEESFADEKIDESGPDETGAGESPEEENGSAFIRTWVAACRGNYSGPTKVVIPKGTFLIGPVVFQGPCNSSTEPIVVEVQGYVKASTDLSQYSSPEWFTFELVDGLIITGDGTFDGQGQNVWKTRDNKESSSASNAPSSLKFNKVNNTLIEGITSLNSKFFHTHMFGCKNVTMSNVHLIAPGDSPNTDGLHISTSSQIKVLNSVMATGDDCVSIGQGSHDITVKNVTCGPGHGISIGSLGKYADELSVSQIYVSNCTFRNTTNGARIKTWAGESAGEATGIIYEDIIMDQVQNPIIIDQNYGAKKKVKKNIFGNKKMVVSGNKKRVRAGLGKKVGAGLKKKVGAGKKKALQGGKKKSEAAGPPSGPASKWKISDVHFRNIRGTSARNVAVSLACSSAKPCEGVELTDINFSYQGTSTKSTALTSECFNAKITSKGVQNPPLCR
ncbi:hypothetical protein ACFX13_008305 [Malus domestica]|uniref:Uncharacterized protein n=1 Tax=Malus domestica TaxID=3750 RepID=A0A498IR30_MALDO|nr:probable galacturan 1,4-alpha-galacturonidase SALK6 isoform X1 [Malus domestica]XP_050112906.1 probable galacturan 1,4-alpha-galacturonidase SALK6 isoform X1 [Malus sylvestris]RXH84362.1 hypothetical protein DVH24_027261 [Malus domestica]